MLVLNWENSPVVPLTSVRELKESIIQSKSSSNLTRRTFNRALDMWQGKNVCQVGHRLKKVLALKGGTSVSNVSKFVTPKKKKQKKKYKIHKTKRLRFQFDIK